MELTVGKTEGPEVEFGTGMWPRKSRTSQPGIRNTRNPIRKCPTKLRDMYPPKRSLIEGLRFGAASTPESMLHNLECASDFVLFARDGRPFDSKVAIAISDVCLDRRRVARRCRNLPPDRRGLRGICLWVKRLLGMLVRLCNRQRPP